MKEPFTWALTVIAVILVLVDNAMSRRSQAKGPRRFFGWYGSERYRQINLLSSVVIVTYFLFAYAAINEISIRKGEGEMVEVHLTDASPPKKLVMLGTTGRFVFLYEE